MKNDDIRESKPVMPVVVPKALMMVVAKWKKKTEEADRMLAVVVETMIDNEVSLAEIKHALLNMGLHQTVASREARILTNLMKYPNEVRRCINGEITIRELRMNMKGDR